VTAIYKLYAMDAMALSTERDNMNTVWKYPLQVKKTQCLELPRGAKPLSIGVQDEKPCLWAQVDTEAVKDSVLVVTHKTGLPMENGDMKFIGTYQLDGGTLVGHVFML
jgi:hypothetical protein